MVQVNSVIQNTSDRDFNNWRYFRELQNLALLFITNSNEQSRFCEADISSADCYILLNSKVHTVFTKAL